ncbi:MAG: hypothetical protein C4527_07430 [Candidatus Omnitrophota bacterium]|jgi:hypothetical protein|nr:MAG: hypothetical protein C4527_07430 [Candidatus Omnitrophota bacterium]
MNTLPFKILVISLLLVGWIGSTYAWSMSESELCQLYLDVVEESVATFEPLWVDESDRIPNSGFFDFRKYGNWLDEPYATIITISGNGMVQFCYSVLLTETDKQVFGKEQVPRATLLDRVIQSLRWCCLTSSYVEHPYPYLPGTRADFADGPYWRRQFSWRADEVGWLTLAAANLWNQLDAETQKLVEAVMIGGAPKERLTQTWYVRQGGNHDQIKQDMSSTMGAAFLFPQREDHDLYLDIIRGNAIDLVSTLQDFANDTVADGKPIREWAKGWNLYQDYSSDHHGWCNLWYGSDLIFEGRSYIEILSHLKGIPVPETFTYPGNGFDGVLEWLKVLCLPQGEPISPHGNEYDAYYGASLLGYCYGAVINKDPIAAAFEERAAQLLARHSRAIKMYDYHRNSWAKAAVAYLLHKFNGPRAEPFSFDDACRALDGTNHYRWHQSLNHRAASHQSVFSWGSISAARPHYSTTDTGLCGFVFPSQKKDDPTTPLMYCHPHSLIGSFEFVDENGQVQTEETKVMRMPESQYHYQYDDAGVHTAGIVQTPPLNRYYAFFSFADSPCIMFTLLRAENDCRIRWSGLPLYFYVRENFTSSRAYCDAQGTQPLEHAAERQSQWWSVNEQQGMAVWGGNGAIKIERGDGYNWARKSEYKDKCDGVFVSPIDNQAMKAGEIGIDLAAAIYPNTVPEKIAHAVEQLKENTLILPAGWRGVFLPDPNRQDRRILAIANFFGADRIASLALTSENGAPILSVPMRINGQLGQTSVHLSSLQTLGEVCSVFLSTEENITVTAQKISEHRFKLIPSGPGITSVQVRYCASGAETIRILDKNETVLHKIDCPPDERFSLKIEAPVIVEMVDKTRGDHSGPGVEIDDVRVREDERVTIEVNANDQSGIQSIELFCNEKLVERKSEYPYMFIHRPGKGAHTYHAVAVDASPHENRRVSLKRTVFVGQ